VKIHPGERGNKEAEAGRGERRAFYFTRLSLSLEGILSFFGFMFPFLEFIDLQNGSPYPHEFLVPEKTVKVFLTSYPLSDLGLCYLFPSSPTHFTFTLSLIVIK